MMKLIKILFLVLCFSGINSNGMEQSYMPFRVGFEFQMHGKLCEWALGDQSLQKKPIFIIEREGKELCHVELDGPDIEFVTEPFSKEEKDQLAVCIKAIKTIIDVTKTQLDSNPVINFNDWLVSLCENTNLQIKTMPFFDIIKERTIKKLNPGTPWEPSWQPQITVQHPLQSTLALCNALFPGESPIQPLIKLSTPTNIKPNTALAGLLFLSAHEMVGMVNSYLMPLHQNRLLNLSMALAMYFHGQDLAESNLLHLSINALSDTKLKELETHPLMREYIAALCVQDEQQQHELLLQLRIQDALFIPKEQSAIVPSFIEFSQIVQNEFMHKAILLQDVFDSFSTVHQFDAKRRTNFMSRRPFSHMLREILDGDNIIISDATSKSLLQENGFSFCFNKNIDFADQLPFGFHLANYGEQFFGADNHPLNLENLLGFFDPTIQGSMALHELLKNGVFCTTMFSVMDMNKSIPNTTITSIAKEVITTALTTQYTEVVLKSLDQPKQREFLYIAKEDPSIIIDAKQLGMTPTAKRVSLYWLLKEILSPAVAKEIFKMHIFLQCQSNKTGVLDCLSPPFLLSKLDAMGRYRKGVFHPKYDPNTFGSAIVEFRNIQLAKHLKSAENTVPQYGFLTIPTFVEEEVLNVFNVICRLTI